MVTPDIVSIGSSVVDVLLKSRSFQPTNIDGELLLCEIYGGKANVEEALLCSGGAGSNTAVSFARQGFVPGIISEVGVDICAQIVIDELSREKVHTDYLIEEPEEKTGISAILIASDGSRSAMTYRGAAHMLSSKDLPFDFLQTVPNIHLSSIGNADVIREVFLFCTTHGIKLSWNPSKAEIEEIVFRSGRIFEKACTVLSMNELEYQAVAQKSDVLKQMATVVVITKGKNGGEVWHDGGVQSYQAQTVTAVDETGAGDAFASGFFGTYIKTQSIEKALEFGVKNATSVVGYLGAKKGLLTV